MIFNVHLNYSILLALLDSVGTYIGVTTDKWLITNKITDLKFLFMDFFFNYRSRLAHNRPIIGQKSGLSAFEKSNKMGMFW